MVNQSNATKMTVTNAEKNYSKVHLDKDGTVSIYFKGKYVGYIALFTYETDGRMGGFGSLHGTRSSELEGQHLSFQIDEKVTA